jgi:hypothetical protein
VAGSRQALQEKQAVIVAAVLGTLAQQVHLQRRRAALKLDMALSVAEAKGVICGS